MRALIVVVLLLGTARAEPPTGYQCAPGTANKGVGCTCPKGTKEKRDGEGIALCAAAVTTTALQQLMALVKKPDLPAAIEFARKYDFGDTKSQQALGLELSGWLRPAIEKSGLAASRGQCQAVNKLAATGDQWMALAVNMVGKKFGKYDRGQDLIDAFTDQLSHYFEPLHTARNACIATASKDDGTKEITAARDADKTLGKCFDDVPEQKTPTSVKVVVDADGVVADVKITSVWPDLDLKISNMQLEMYRLKLIAERDKCFVDELGAWKFKPNARGFAATIQVKK